MYIIYRGPICILYASLVSLDANLKVKVAYEYAFLYCLFNPYTINL